MIINQFNFPSKMGIRPLIRASQSRKIYTPPPPPSLLSHLQLPNQNNARVKEIEKQIKTAVLSRTITGPIDCGAKYQKLEELNFLFKGQPKVEIPSFKGIPSATILSFLNEKAPAVIVEWEQLKEMNLNATSFQKNISVDLALERIEYSLKQAFSCGEFPFDKIWLEEQAKKDHFLIVRSTGCEDSSFANAGANESVSYVPPENILLGQAIGRVVASYFSKKSLQMRLNNGSNPFQEKLQLSVFVQELIGEKISEAPSESDIPISFVLFTNESYSQKEDFRVMQIALTYGHGEGVVKQQKSGTDFVQVLVSRSKPDKLYVLYETGKKKQRKAPFYDAGQVTLADRANPKELINKRALNANEIFPLFTSSLLIENLLGTQSDIEGVIKNGKIYFFQARALHQKETLPSYLFRKGKKVIPVKPLAGRASVITVTSNDAILARKNLELAQRDFDISKHSLVLVKDDETSKNSHAIVNFKGLGIPCLQIQENFKIELPLAVDMQTGTLHLWDKDAIIQDAIASGFRGYPGSIATITIPDGLDLRKEALNDIAQLLHELQLHETPQEAFMILEKIEKNPTIQDLSQRIKEIEKQSQGIKGIVPYLALLKELEHEIANLFEELKVVLQQGGKIESLFYIKALETYLLGDGYSLCRTKATFEAISTLMNYQKKFSHPSQCEDMLLYGNDEWRSSLLDLEQFLHEHAISREEFLQFKNMIETLRELGALPFWMVFLQQELPPLQRFKQALPDREFIEKLLHTSQEIQRLHDRIDLFLEPETFSEELKTLQKFQNEVPLEKMKHSASITKIIGYQVLLSLVTLFDDVAKAVKSNQHSQYRVKQFKDVLMLYYPLMEKLAKVLVPQHFSDWNIDSEYFNVISHTLNDLPSDDVSQLWPSKDFSVSGAMLGSRSWLERHMPEHLEDILTLIHQNCLISLSTFQQSVLTNEIIATSLLPQKIKSVMEELQQQLGTNHWKLLKTGINVTAEEMTFKYNIPLNAHSGSIELNYDIFSKEMTFKGRFLGEARSRWNEISMWFSILGELCLIPLNAPVDQTQQEITFSWKITEENQRNIVAEYKAAAIQSFRKNNSIEKYLIDRIEYWGSSKGVLQRIDKYLASTHHPYLVPFRKGLSISPPQDSEECIYVLMQILSEKKKDEFQLFLSKPWTRSAIQHVMQKGDPAVQETLLDLFQKVVDESTKLTSFDYYKKHFLKHEFPSYLPLEPQNICLSAAMLATSIGISSSHSLVRKKSNILFRHLLEKGYVTQSDYRWMLLAPYLKFFKDVFR